MISYKWTLSAEQPFDKSTVFELQTHLAAVGVYLDLSWNDNAPQLSISVPRCVLQEETASDIEQKSTSEKNPEETPDSSKDPVQLKHRGRPLVSPENDITLGRVLHMQFMGVSAEDIAKTIGISRRTYFRILKNLDENHYDPETPFSKCR